MRIIKFRSYNKIVGMEYNIQDRSTFHKMLNNKNYQIMQFTGLTDKLGKEIYEGDIIKYSYPIGYSLCEIKFGIYDNGESYEDYEGGNGWYFEEHKFYYGRKTRGVNIYSLETGHYPLNTYECEVIGNIYNNPELLKEKP